MTSHYSFFLLRHTNSLISMASSMGACIHPTFSAPQYQLYYQTFISFAKYNHFLRNYLRGSSIPGIGPTHKALVSHLPRLIHSLPRTLHTNICRLKSHVITASKHCFCFHSNADNEKLLFLRPSMGADTAGAVVVGSVLLHYRFFFRLTFHMETPPCCSSSRAIKSTFAFLARTPR